MKSTMLTLNVYRKKFYHLAIIEKIIRKCPASSLYNLIHHPLEVTLREPNEMTSGQRMCYILQ